LKQAITLISLIVLLSTQTLVADEVDFSKAYIITPTKALTDSETSENDEEDQEPTDSEEPTDEIKKVDAPPTLQIGGVETTGESEGEIIVFNWILFLNSPDNITFEVDVREVKPQNYFDPQLLQQRLRGTTWNGDYNTSKNLYFTQLELISVQNGFVGGEITHSTDKLPLSPSDDPPSSFLQARVAGDIITQYQIEEGDDGKLVWVSVSEYEKRVAKINQANEGKEGDNVTPAPEILDARLKIRLKRTRDIAEKTKHASSRWGSHNEYRLILEKDEETGEYNKITGNVGTPPESYGSSDVLTGNGKIELTISDDSQPVKPPVPE
jgi:hypothetical protein